MITNLKIFSFFEKRARIILRPLLAKWLPLLQDWEAKRLPNLSPKKHKQQWSEKENLRDELEKLRQDLKQYANALAEIAGVEESQEEYEGW